jgi:mannose-1-phosphate guanylyltransferase
MSSVKALVLCGGEGKRLRPITYYIQKTMIPIGYNQRPLLEYVVRLLKFHGINDINLLVGYKAEQIQNYFNDGTKFDVEISYIHDSQTLGGNGGAVINAYQEGGFDENDLLLVYYGDILTNMNLTQLISFSKDRKATATVALASSFEVRVGVAEIEEDGKIRGFIEKPKLEKPVSIGLLALKGKAFGEARRLIRNKTSLDLMGDVLPYLIAKGERVYGYVSDAFWYDVGSTEAYEKLNNKRVKEAFSFLP